MKTILGAKKGEKNEKEAKKGEKGAKKGAELKGFFRTAVPRRPVGAYKRRYSDIIGLYTHL